MKKSILKTSNRIYGYIIGLLGFSMGCQACESGAKMYGSPPVEYGTPTASYVISGKVTDAKNNPIKDINVNVVLNNNSVEQISTKDNGEYRFENSSYTTDLRYTITYQDIDGAENGGEFADQTKNVVFSSADFTGGDGNWNQGKAEKVVNVVLEEKAE